MSCQIDNDSGEMAHFSVRQMRKARKAYKCFECSETIQPGEIYEHVSGKWEDSMLAFRTCALCAEIKDKVFCTYAFGEVWEDLRQESVMTLSLAGLSVPAIEKLEAFWKEVAKEREEEGD